MVEYTGVMATWRRFTADEDKEIDEFLATQGISFELLEAKLTKDMILHELKSLLLKNLRLSEQLRHVAEQFEQQQEALKGWSNPITAEELGQASGLHPNSVRRLLRTD